MSIFDQLFSIQTIVALCTGIGVFFTIYQNHKIKTNDLRHLEGNLHQLAKYTIAIGNASQKLHEAMSDIS